MAKRLIIMGSAPCAREDLERIPAFDRYDFMALGLDAARETCSLPVKYVATNHIEDIIQIRSARVYASGNLDYKLISYKHASGVDIVQPLGPVSGSSSILGAEHIINFLCDRYFFRRPEKRDRQAAKLDTQQQVEGLVVQFQELASKMKHLTRREP